MPTYLMDRIQASLDRYDCDPVPIEVDTFQFLYRMKARMWYVVDQRSCLARRAQHLLLLSYPWLEYTLYFVMRLMHR